MSEEKKKFSLSPRAKKVINIVVDVVAAVILLLALFLAICTISSRRKGYSDYTEIFGKAYLSVKSDSMEGDEKDNFSAGDLIAIKLLNDDAAKTLEVGDIITFRDDFAVNGKYVLNSHRIIEVTSGDDGSVVYTTHGDHNPASMTESVKSSEVIGVYTGKASGVGKVLLFMSSSTGFFVCIVLPTLLVVVYCVVNLVLVIRKEKKAQTAAAEEEAAQKMDAEREKIRAELLAEMQGSAPDGSTGHPELVTGHPEPAEGSHNTKSDQPDNPTE